MSEMAMFRQLRVYLLTSLAVNSKLHVGFVHHVEMIMANTDY